MIDPFVRDGRSGLIMGSFSVVESQVLRSLASGMIELLRDDQPLSPDGRDPLEAMLDFSGPSNKPIDPILARLLPDAYGDDQDAAADFRRFTEGSLRDSKAGVAEELIMSLVAGGLEHIPEDPDQVIDVQLTDLEADSWLRALNDLRLALGTQLELGTHLQVGADSEGAGAPVAGARPSEDVVAVAGIYDYLSAIQSWLLEAIDGDYADDVTASLTLDQATYDAIVAHAKQDHPDEACGVVAGRFGSDLPTRFVPMINAASSPTFYEFDSGEMFALYKEMDDRDEEPVIIYHSHTATEAFPSRTDIGLAMEPNAHYVLVSTREHGNNDGPVEFRSFRIIDGEVTEEDVVIVANLEEH